MVLYNRQRSGYWRHWNRWRA